MLKQITSRIIYNLPRRPRWKLARSFGGDNKRWLQWIYDHDGDYTLRGMRERNCIFIHIPKCAGISVADALLGSRGGAHATADDYLSVFGAKWFDQAFKFTFVRDPWSRTVSAFDFLRRGGLHKWDAAFADAHLKNYGSIEEFIEHGLCRPEIRTWQHFRDQASYLIDPRTNDLCVDYLGRVETIEKDFNAICDKLNISTRLELQNARAKTAPDESPQLSVKAIDRIAEIYARDIELLGYSDYPAAQHNT